MFPSWVPILVLHELFNFVQALLEIELVNLFGEALSSQSMDVGEVPDAELHDLGFDASPSCVWFKFLVLSVDVLLIIEFLFTDLLKDESACLHLLPEVLVASGLNDPLAPLLCKNLLILNYACHFLEVCNGWHLAVTDDLLVDYLNHEFFGVLIIVVDLGVCDGCVRSFIN